MIEEIIVYVNLFLIIVFIISTARKLWKKFDYEDKEENMKRDIEISNSINVDIKKVNKAREKLSNIDRLN